VRSFFWLDASMLKRSHQQMGVRSLAGLEERKHIGTTISHMYDGGPGGKLSRRITWRIHTSVSRSVR
jgi:hypothetical protein